jgi:hypothetical protein
MALGIGRPAAPRRASWYPHGEIEAPIPGSRRSLRGAESSIAFSLWAHGGAASSRAAVGASKSIYYVGKKRIPSRQRSERLRLRCARVAAFALKQEDVLAEVVG